MSIEGIIFVSLLFIIVILGVNIIGLSEEVAQLKEREREND